MPVGRQVARALSALWLARAVGIALNLLFLPLLFRHLPPDELGVWLLMGQAGAIVALMDFGVTSVFTRRVAMASTRDGAEAEAEAADLIVSARPIYLCAAGLVFAGSLLAGRLMLPGLGLDAAAAARVEIAWVLLCASYACNLLGGMWTGAVGGFGYVATVSALGAGVGLANVAAQATSVLLGGGVVALAALSLAGSVVQRWIALRVLRSRRPLLFSTVGRPRRELAVGLLRASSRWWLTELGAIALLRTDQIFIAALQQASQIPAYYAAYSMTFSMAAAAMAVAEAANVFVSRTWREGEPWIVHALVLRGTRIGLSLMLCGVGVLTVVGEAVISSWVGPGHFIGRPILLVFCATLVLYVQQSLLLGFSRATENEAYAPCYLAAGALNVLVTWLLAGPFGALGVAAGTLVAQLATTSWYVPRSALRQLRIGWKTYATRVLLPAAQCGALACAATLIAASSAGAGSHLHRAAAGGLAGGAATLAGLWFLAFDTDIRRYVRREAASLVRRLRASEARRGGA